MRKALSAGYSGIILLGVPWSKNVAVGDRRYLFENVPATFLTSLQRYQSQYELLQSCECAELSRKITESSEGMSGDVQKISRFAISSRIVRRVAVALAPFAHLRVLALVSGCALLYRFLALHDPVRETLRQSISNLDLADLLCIVAMYLLSVLVHELGHATVCFKRTGLVGAISLRLSRGLPVVSADVSSVHLVDRVCRGQVAVAGPLFQMFFASLVLYIGTPSAVIGGVIAFLAATFSLLPLPGSDGFWLLNDVFEMDLPNVFRIISF